MLLITFAYHVGERDADVGKKSGGSAAVFRECNRLPELSWLARLDVLKRLGRRPSCFGCIQSLVSTFPPSSYFLGE